MQFLPVIVSVVHIPLFSFTQCYFGRRSTFITMSDFVCRQLAALSIHFSNGAFAGNRWTLTNVWGELIATVPLSFETYRSRKIWTQFHLPTSGKRCSVRVLLRSKMAGGGLQVGSEATSMLHVILALPRTIFVSSFTGNNNQLCFLWCTKFSVTFIRLVFPATYFNARLSDLYDHFSPRCFSFSYEIVTSPDLTTLIRFFFYFCCFTLNIAYRHIDHYNW